MSPEEEVEAFWHVRSITAELRGLLLPGDVIEPAGYVEGEFPRRVSRLVRDGDVIGSFDVRLVGMRGSETWRAVDPDDPGAGVLIPMIYEIRARVCDDAGLGFVER